MKVVGGVIRALTLLLGILIIADHPSTWARVLGAAFIGFYVALSDTDG